MKRWLILSLLAGSAAVQAAPNAPAEDELQRFIADKSLLSRIEQVRHQVTDRASDLVLNAMGFLGVPYRRGGDSAETGFDCSGFVRAMYEQTVGLILPRRANEQAAATEAIEKQDLQPGDLVFFNTLRRTFSHVGIYVGGGKFIHSPKPGAQVRVEDMGVSYWASRFDGARRVIMGRVSGTAVPAQAAATSPSAPTAAVPTALPTLAAPLRNSSGSDFNFLREP